MMTVQTESAPFPKDLEQYWAWLGWAFMIRDENPGMDMKEALEKAREILL